MASSFLPNNNSIFWYLDIDIEQPLKLKSIILYNDYFI